MVYNSEASLNTVFSALADPTRRAIIQRLTQGEATVTELASPFDMSLPAISKHIRVLESAGLLTRRREGRVHHLSLNANTLQEASEWLNTYRTFWQSSFDALADFIENYGEQSE